jgi:peptide/nickel transport system ATP-binding protein
MPDAADSISQAPPLVRAKGLVKHFDVSKNWLVRFIERQPKLILKAVDGVDFEIRKGETFSLVGESGCGKSTVARLIVGLYRPTDGSVHFDGTNMTSLSAQSEAAKLRQRMQMIFQDPYASLNPRWRVANIISEPLRAFGIAKTKAELRERVNLMLKGVGLSPDDGEKYPHEFSGGQRQRISIARALSANPDFLICDEPTSALDVSVQAQILNLMKDLQEALGLTYLFISHNLAVVYHVSDRIGVMYLGKLCEITTARNLFRSPKHPYTRLLLNTIPDLSLDGTDRQPMGGEVPNPINPPKGCAFHPRCPFTRDRCRTEAPLLRDIDGSLVACHTVDTGDIPVQAPIPPPKIL